MPRPDIPAEALDTLVAQLQAGFQVGPEPWVVTVNDGRLIGYDPDGRHLGETYKDLALDLVRRLNTEVHHGGVWAVAWDDFDPMGRVPRRLVLGHFDADGDNTVCVDCVEPIWVMHSLKDQWVGDAEEAIYRRYGWERDLDITDEHKIRAALGETPARLQ